MPSIKQSSLSQATSIGAVTTENTIVTADALFRNNLTGLLITTLNAAVSTFTIREATGGATRSVFDFPTTAAVPLTPFLIMFDPPQQGLLNSAWTIQASASATGYKVTAFFVKDN